MLCTNQCVDKLTASTIDFRAHGMLNESIWTNYADPPPPPPGATNDDDDGGRIDDQDIMAEVKLAKEPSTSPLFHSSSS